MSIHVTRAPTVPLTSYDTKRSSHLNFEWFFAALYGTSFVRTKIRGPRYYLKGKAGLQFITFAAPPITWSFRELKWKVRAATIICGSTRNQARHVSVSPLIRFNFMLSVVDSKSEIVFSSTLCKGGAK